MEQQPSNSSTKKSHLIRNIIIVVIILLIIAGIIAYFVNKNDNKTTASTSQTSGQSTSTQSSNTFNPAVNSNQPYSATIATTVNGQQKSATMISDGQGSYSYTYQANGNTLTTIYTPSAYYLCTSSTSCIKYPTTSAASSGFDPTAYQYDSTKIASLKNSAAYKGQQACPNGGGTCDVWSVNSDNATSTVYINTSSKRIVKATSVSGTTSSEVTYDYKSVDIAIPTNYTTAP